MRLFSKAAWFGNGGVGSQQSVPSAIVVNNARPSGLLDTAEASCKILIQVNFWTIHPFLISTTQLLISMDASVVEDDQIKTCKGVTSRR